MTVACWKLQHRVCIWSARPGLKSLWLGRMRWPLSVAVARGSNADNKQIVKGGFGDVFFLVGATVDPGQIPFV